jgi:anhydro-N-acetylmuramic acid kinase
VLAWVFAFTGHFMKLKNNMQKYHVIGLMSGTSLDGLDIAYCTFQLQKSKWQYTLNCAETIKYSKDWYLKLKEAHLLNSEGLLQIHSEYGILLGKKVLSFIKKHKLKDIDFVSSHGHTIFHSPKKGFTFQLGNGASLVSTCGIKVVCDFRIMDVALKGQGAPLVPIGDKLLFPEYDFCLNLGGFSNISYEHKGNRIAFDICPVNTALNYLASAKGKSFDKNGGMAKSGKVNAELLGKLNALGYYYEKEPKSLGREWLSDYFLPIIDRCKIPVEDKLATVIEHITFQLSQVMLSLHKKGKLLISGGGANNKFLVSKLIEKLPSHNVIIPPQNIINYKEALVFAFLGVLKMEGRINTLHSVTGAIKSSSGGVVFVP